MHIWPKPGFKVWDPETLAWLLPEGRDVEATNLYWSRKVDHGDVVLEEPKAPVVEQAKDDEPKVGE